MANSTISLSDKVRPDFSLLITRQSVVRVLGQDVVAERALEQGCLNGHWVVLQNIHLVARWLPQLEKKLEQTAETASDDFRVFLSAEPAPDPDGHVNTDHPLPCPSRFPFL